MAKQRTGLGRGLDSLISGASDVLAAQQQGTQQNEKAGMLELPLESIIPNPHQPRRAFREDDPKLLELSASIKEHGLLQPIIVVRLDQNIRQKEAQDAVDAWFGADTPAAPPQPTVDYQIIAGERRWRASRLAGLTKVPVIVKDVSPQQMLELALIENIQRADLNPIEEALAYQSLIQEFGLTQEMVAKQVGKERSTITNSLRLLQLCPKVRDAIINQSEVFTEGHARALVGLPEESQLSALNQIIALRLNVRQTEELAKRLKMVGQASSAPSKSEPAQMQELDDIESQFRNALMVKVDLKRNAKGKGTLVLHFNDQEELERLYSRLVKQAE